MPQVMMPVRSTAIRAIGYDTDTNTLFIEFNKTNQYPTYEYAPVGAHTAGRMFKAHSIGSYYHRIIKNRTSYQLTASEFSLPDTIAYRRGVTDIAWTAAKAYAERMGI